MLKLIKNREIKDELFKEIVDKTEKVSKQIANGKIKTMTASEFKQHMKSINK